MSGRFPSCSESPLEEGGLSGSPLLWHACPAPHGHGRRRAPCWVSRVPRGLRTTFPVQQMLSAPALVGVVARDGGKGVGLGAYRLCVAGVRAGRRRTLMLEGSGWYGLSLLCLLLLSTSCRYLRSASFRLDGLRHNENPPETLPVDGRDPSTPLGDVNTLPPSLRGCVDNEEGAPPGCRCSLPEWRLWGELQS